MDSNPALILIDVQKGFSGPFWGRRNNPDADNVMGRMLECWRKKRWPVVHVQHLSLDPKSPLHPSHPGSKLMERVSPIQGERIFTKEVNSAFIGTDLESWLKSSDIETLVFSGFTTDHCVSTSVRMARNLGFNPTILADATVTFDRIDHEGVRHSAEIVHAISLASLNGEFATVCDSDVYLEN